MRAKHTPKTTNRKARAILTIQMLAASAMGLGAPIAAQAVTGTWTGGNTGANTALVWNLTDLNWSGLPAGTPWDVTNGPNNVALFNTVGDAPGIRLATVIPGTMIFSESATVNDQFRGQIGFGSPLTGPLTAMTVQVDANKTGTINAPIVYNHLATHVANAAPGSSGNQIKKTGAGTLILAGPVDLADDTNIGLNAGFTVEGGGELQISGKFKAANTLQASTRSNFLNRVGDTTSNNTVIINGLDTDQVFIAGGLVVGNAGGGNEFYITRPGDATIPSYRMRGNGQQLVIGNNSDDNLMEVSNGAFFRHDGGSGTTGVRLGYLAGADNNKILVTGTGSTFSLAAGSIIVGTGGSNNDFTVSNGGTVITPRWLVGVASDFGQVTGGAVPGNGDNNTVLITGLNSLTTINAGTNSVVEIGGLGSDGNSFTVADSATFNFTGAGNTGRSFSVGMAGGNNNLLKILDAGSSVNVNFGMPVAIGGTALGVGVITPGGTGNHLDIFDGGAMVTNTSVILTGTNSAINLGDGAAVSSLTIGDTTNFNSGIQLTTASSVLKIDSGRLIAGLYDSSDLNMVQGPGQVILEGDAFFLNSQANLRVIASQITGSGDFFKEGTSELQLTSPLNDYTGNTTILQGVLELTNIFLADAADVVIAPTAQIDLTYQGIDDINAFSIDGGTTYLAPGIYGAGDLPGVITGSGQLRVRSQTPNNGNTNPPPTVEVPEPATASLLGLAGLLGLRRRNRTA